MHRALFFVAVAAAIVSSPLNAQQTQDAPATPIQQSIPDGANAPSQEPASQLPSTSQQQPTLEPVPPPFPPMHARPTHRWVDVGEGRTAHTRHRTAKSHRARTSRPAIRSSRTMERCERTSSRKKGHHGECRKVARHDQELAMRRHHHAAERHPRHGSFRRADRHMTSDRHRDTTSSRHHRHHAGDRRDISSNSDRHRDTASKRHHRHLASDRHRVVTKHDKATHRKHRAVRDTRRRRKLHHHSKAHSS